MNWIKIVYTFVRGGLAEVQRQRARPHPTPEDAARDQARALADVQRIEDRSQEAFGKGRSTPP